MKILLCMLCSLILFSSSSFAHEITAPKIVAPINKISPVVQETFGYIRVHRQGKGVSVNWGMNSMSGIAYFIIERSYDGEYFDPIHQAPMNGSKRNSWKDDDIFPGYIHYRIVCVMNDGSKVYSETDTVRIVQRG